MTHQNGFLDPQVGFLPINQVHSPPGSKPRRAYLSCERCRKRKSRCEPASGQSQPCKRCSTDNQPCEFRASRRTKRNSTIPTQVVEPALHQSHDFVVSDSTLSEPHNVSLSPANDSQRTGDISMTDEFESPSVATPALDARTRLVSTHIHNTSDALDLLTFAATGNRVYNDSSTTPGQESQGPSAIPPTAAYNSPGNLDRVWSSFILIRKGVVSQQEVTEYLDFFFHQLWPLKPVVPSYYRSRTNYGQLIAEEPLLGVCLVTLSSRYFPLPGSHGEIRSERIHWQTWKFLQRFLQSVMWGSTTTRTLGTISAMLLLLDWHIKAINNPTDFTDGDDEVIGVVDDASFKAPPVDKDSLSGQRRYGMTSLMEKLNIVSPAYRSNKMSWMLLSSAIALAHEGCCFDNEAPGSSATPSSLDHIRKEWNRLICVFLYLADEGLATRLGLEPLLPEKARQAVKDRFSTTFADSLPDSMLWESYFELSIETGKGREFLYSLKKPGMSLSNLDLVPHLEHLRRALSRWKRQYYHRETTNPLLSSCVDMEVHYVTLFCFAPAGQVVHSSSKEAPRESFQALLDFADEAALASHALLCIVVDVLEPSGLMKYLPVRCWLFIVAASLHLLKATLAKNQEVTQTDPNICLLRRVINAVHNGSPDDAHMAIRFAKFLGIMVQVALPTGFNSIDASSGEEGGEHGSHAGLQVGDGFRGVAYSSVFNNEDVAGGGNWDVLLDLEVVPDPFTWWQSMHDANVFTRFV
ncbi:hypothetical protein FDECE_7269 [Fusarium decemcellulare]|nr:hypothetical protein FDECE_7269 [Fusarium decemcellulare]